MDTAKKDVPHIQRAPTPGKKVTRKRQNPGMGVRTITEVSVSLRISRAILPLHRAPRAREVPILSVPHVKTCLVDGAKRDVQKQVADHPQTVDGRQVQISRIYIPGTHVRNRTQAKPHPDAVPSLHG